jgi:hypothetical protein
MNDIGSNVHNHYTYNNSQLLSAQPLPTRNSMPVRVTAETSLPAPTQSVQRNDDSRMIDSLFGSSNGLQTTNAVSANKLMTGFNSLSSPNESDGMKSSGLWGSSGLYGDNSTAATPSSSSIGNIFSQEAQERSQESRFNWNSRNI